MKQEQVVGKYYNWNTDRLVVGYAYSTGEWEILAGLGIRQNGREGTGTQAIEACRRALVIERTADHTDGAHPSTIGWGRAEISGEEP